MTSHTQVGMIGLGLMGTALSARLIDARISVIGFDVDPGRCAAFADIGGKPAASAAEIMARCRTVVVAVYSAAQVQSLLDATGAASDLSHSVMICTTTCAPGEILAIAG